MRFTRDGRVEVTLPQDWENVYRSPDQSFAYSVYDANKRVVAQSSKIATALPLIDLGRLGPR